nr:hypothetical protein [Tanacetum cinerariifolium]
FLHHSSANSWQWDLHSSGSGNTLHWQWELILPVGTLSWQWEYLVHFIPNIIVQTLGSGISIILAVGTPSTGSGNLYCQWELSPSSGNALIWYDEDVHDLRYVETKFPIIVFDNALTSKVTPFYEPTVSPLNANKIDFRISFDESDEEDYTPIKSKVRFESKDHGNSPKNKALNVSTSANDSPSIVHTSSKKQPAKVVDIPSDIGELNLALDDMESEEEVEKVFDETTNLSNTRTMASIYTAPDASKT